MNKFGRSRNRASLRVADSGRANLDLGFVGADVEVDLGADAHEGEDGSELPFEHGDPEEAHLRTAWLGRRPEDGEGRDAAARAGLHSDIERSSEMRASYDGRRRSDE